MREAPCGGGDGEIDVVLGASLQTFVRVITQKVGLANVNAEGTVPGGLVRSRPSPPQPEA